jgi:cytochrome c
MLKGYLAIAAATLSSTSAVAQSGDVIFKQRCGMCHIPGRSLIGPDLTGLATRKARPAFAYSAAMSKTPVKWDAKRLDAFLAAPQKIVTGTKMMIAMPAAADRALVVAYLLKLRAK